MIRLNLRSCTPLALGLSAALTLAACGQPPSRQAASSAYGAGQSADAILAANPSLSEQVAVKRRTPPPPGTDVVMLNDINPFTSFMAEANNQRFVTNLVTYVPTNPTRAGSKTVWFDRGHASNNCTNNECNDAGLTPLKTYIEGLGYSVAFNDSATGTLTSVPAEVKVIFLWMPQANFTNPEINALKLFAKEGGRIVFVGEWNNFYGAGGIATENDFLTKMGAGMQNIGNAVDCGRHDLPAASLRPSAITAGMNGLTIACASVVTLGPKDYALFYDTTNQLVLGAVAAIDTTPLP